MADVLLGPLGAEVTLPVLSFMGGKPSLPVSADKQIDMATMSDKSRRWNFGMIKRAWSRELGYLTKAQLDALLALNALNQTLHFQDNNIDATWYYVVITAFSWEPERTDILSLGRYKCQITLEEA